MAQLNAGKEPKILEVELRAFADKLPSLCPHIHGEEATKTALIWPVLKILGYDPFDITEVVPEYPAPPGLKLGKKVDMVVFSSGQPVIMGECKWCGQGLKEKDADQLKEYFPFINSCRLAILTNGIEYRFYADIEAPNIMDKEPFFSLTLKDFRQDDFPFLGMFAKGFDADNIIEWAKSRTQRGKIRDGIRELMANPTPEFVKLVVKSKLGFEKVGHVMLETYTAQVKAAGAELLEKKVSLIEETQVVISTAPPETDTLKKRIKELEQVIDRMKEELGRTSEELASIEDLRKGAEELPVLRSMLTNILLAPTLKFQKKAAHMVTLLDKEDNAPLCHIYFEPSQRELGVVDEDASEMRILLRRFMEPPQRINNLLKLLEATEVLRDC